MVQPYFPIPCLQNSTLRPNPSLPTDSITTFVSNRILVVASGIQWQFLSHFPHAANQTPVPTQTKPFKDNKVKDT